MEEQELRARLQHAIKTLKDLRWGLFSSIETVEKTIDDALLIIEGPTQNQDGYFDYQANQN
jgi:hypothetical protein